MEQKILNLLHGKGQNYIFPFLWVHGEEESVLREYMRAIHDCGIGAVCIESRPHPDYCGPKWWQDMDVILDEAKKRNMKVWILDDSHFPTGYANGALKDAPPELCRQYLYYSSVETVGPMKSMQLDIARHVRYTPNPMSASIFSMGRPPRRHFDDDTLVSVCAARIDQGFDASTLTDLTGRVKDGRLVWDVPAGRWVLFVNFLTRNAGCRDHYINMLDKASARKQIEAVYEPHYRQYGDEFGKTIAGFFSDEPELGNGQMYSQNSAIGQDQDLPWSSAVAEQMKARLGDSWKTMLPLLWENGPQKLKAAKVRLTYMDIVTRLVEENFSKPLGRWCQERGVEYIGHLIEDNNAHARLGPSLGHFFRGLSGQHMSGIDDIGGQVMPAGEIYPKKALIGSRDGEFFHYMLGKLGTSAAAIDPSKQGRTLCEIFGAYGWSLGVRKMKYLTDHFLVRGVNHYVPHAFTAKPYPDPDCPPHFYADGHDPQFRHFGSLMRYLNHMCALISNGKRTTPAAILYHAEAEWTGDLMLSQKPAHILMDHQIDFDIVPADIFTEAEYYRTVIGPLLSVHQQEYKVMIVPYTQFITESLARSLAALEEAGCPVIFVGGLPEGIVDGDNDVLASVSGCRTVPLEKLAEVLTALSIPEITAEPAFSMLRYLHYLDGNDVYLFNNESVSETFSGIIAIPSKGPHFIYDVWKNELRTVRSGQKGDSTLLYLEIPACQSLVVVSGTAGSIPVKPDPAYTNELRPDGTWTMSLASAKEYPGFHDNQEIASFESIGLHSPEFSGFIRYEKVTELPAMTSAILVIEDAREAVEVFVNGTSAGIMVAPPFAFDISHLVQPGENRLRIEVATLLERERHFAPPIPGDFTAMLSKSPVLEPMGILGDVKILYI